MSQCHDPYPSGGWTGSRRVPPPLSDESPCHDSYDEQPGRSPGRRQGRRAASTSLAWSGTTRPRRSGRS